MPARWRRPHLKGARRPQRIDVVDHVGAGANTARITSGFTVSTETGTPHSRRASTTGSRRSLRREPGNRMRTGAGRLGANVEDVRTFVDQPMGLRDRGGGIAVQTVAGKGIVGQVDDAHDQRASAFSTWRPQ
jgi:hypothetical protein